MTETEVMTIKEAADYLRVHWQTVRLMLKDGRLHGVKVGRQWRIRRSDIDALLAGPSKTEG